MCLWLSSVLKLTVREARSQTEHQRGSGSDHYSGRGGKLCDCLCDEKLLMYFSRNLLVIAISTANLAAIYSPTVFITSNNKWQG